MTITAVQDDTTPAFSIRQPHISDEAWALIAPLLPGAAATGHPRKWALRLLLEAVLYLLRTGCQWRALPATFPPYSTVQRHFYGWRDAGSFERLNHLLVMSDREREGREAAPTAGVIDSQSVKTSETGGTKGYDSGKKIMGLKRHILVDTTGRLLGACISPADLHDSRAAVHLLQASRRPWRSSRRSGPMQPIAATASEPLRPSASRSSRDHQTNAASSCKNGDGSSSAASHGSDATGASQRTTNASHRPHSLSSSSPPLTSS